MHAGTFKGSTNACGLWCIAIAVATDFIHLKLEFGETGTLSEKCCYLEFDPEEVIVVFERRKRLEDDYPRILMVVIKEEMVSQKDNAGSLSSANSVATAIANAPQSHAFGCL